MLRLVFELLIQKNRCNFVRTPIPEDAIPTSQRFNPHHPIVYHTTTHCKTSGR